jgi:4-hydroxythreonine-4-phosphate dehydrogenase
MTAAGEVGEIDIPPLALTMGEPAGIGAEIALKAWMKRGGEAPVFVLLDDPQRLEALSRRLGWKVPVQVVNSPAEAVDVFAAALPVLPLELPRGPEPGRPDPAFAKAIVAAIENAVRLTQAGETAAVVTNPIHKKSLHDAGFPFPGHTEFLAALAGGARPVMMLASGNFRVAPVTGHVSLAEAIESLTAGAIVETAEITARALRRDFAIKAPRLAVAGLNPHAGEEGGMGDEEETIIRPAIETLSKRGIETIGPVPPDSLFTDTARSGYDAAICMYHDQALIPIKALAFASAVNVTLGLPIVRTSPDHGTAFDIAGTGKASASSLMAALAMAAAIAKRRARMRQSA